MTRSRDIATVLARIARRERDLKVSERIDQVLAELEDRDLEPVKHLRAARGDEGTEW